MFWTSQKYPRFKKAVGFLALLTMAWACVTMKGPPKSKKVKASAIKPIPVFAVDFDAAGKGPSSLTIHVFQASRCDSVEEKAGEIHYCDLKPLDPKYKYLTVGPGRDVVWSIESGVATIPALDVGYILTKATSKMKDKNGDFVFRGLVEVHTDSSRTSNFMQGVRLSSQVDGSGPLSGSHVQEFGEGLKISTTAKKFEEYQASFAERQKVAEQQRAAEEVKRIEKDGYSIGGLLRQCSQHQMIAGEEYSKAWHPKAKAKISDAPGGDYFQVRQLIGSSPIRLMIGMPVGEILEDRPEHWCVFVLRVDKASDLPVFTDNRPLKIGDMIGGFEAVVSGMYDGQVRKPGAIAPTKVTYPELRLKSKIQEMIPNGI